VTIMANQGRPGAGKERITIERTYKARISEVWDLWTTKEGIESWWGPDGFAVHVRSIDLRPGGELRYAMTTTATRQIEFMKRAGMPLTNEHLIVYTEVQPPARLAYSHLVDFIPGVESYEVAMLVELHETAGGVRMVLTIDRMHDDVWTERAIAGWEMELRKLETVVDIATKLEHTHE
jgi:uncharacterized protein YndB with AHSA1/START domain